MFGDLGPGQMPYRVLTPAAGGPGSNLLAPVPCSATHLGYGALRLEPQFMILGEASGVAAAMAVAGGTSVQDVDVPALQAALRKRGAKLAWPLRPA